MKKQIKILSNLKNKKLLASYDYEMLCSLMFKAAKIANKTFSKFKWKRKRDKSLLTKADTEIELLFAKFCDHPDKGMFLIGEETIDSKGQEYVFSALKGKTWIIDPIDGTAPFACNLPTWGISIAYAERGKIIEGAIFLPSIGEFYISFKGKNYYAEGVNLNDHILNFKELTTKNAN
ncbi:MAG TPA: inositol monophosphatase family protein, partial [Victivallales bacterium]|nr:inositol monophosphatase family protein [Victivallales bacterium]